jgi:hypothetical protein
MLPTYSPAPTSAPSLSPTATPTSTPTTIADFYPKYVLTLLVRCIQVDNTNKQGPSNHTYNMYLSAGDGDEYTTTNPVVFDGLGYVTSTGQPISYREYDTANGDLSCDENEGGGSEEMALIYDYEIGSATHLGFQNNLAEPFGEHADDKYELTKVCFELMTPFRRPASHDGVEIDVAITQYDVSGTTTYVMNATVDMHNKFDVGDTACSFLHPLKYDFKFGGFNNQTIDDMKQNSITFEATIQSEFDADISMIAFPYDDNITTRGERAGIATQYGDRLLSPTTAGSYIEQKSRDYFYDSPARDRDIIGYELSAAWDSKTQQVVPMCDAACVAAGGKYQSWHVTTVVEWNFTKSTGNPNSLWADVITSTYGKPLRMFDEKRNFAVTYDKTEPTYSFVKDSIKFKYSNNVTKCGSRYYDPLAKSVLDMPDTVDIICTSTEDTLAANITISEEGAYYFYAHPSFQQKTLEANFSGVIGVKWPGAVTELGLYSLHYACHTDTDRAASGCDSYGSFPRDIPVIIPMDPEAYIFGYDFSFSEFAIYGFVQDDGFTSENTNGNSLNHAPGYDDFLKVYGNQTYELVDKELMNELTVKTPDLFYRSNNYNTTEWTDSRYLVVSSKDSDFSNIIELQTDAYGYTTNFGRRTKIFFGLNKLANEFDYPSHRLKFYNRPITGDVLRYQAENYLINTDSFYNELEDPVSTSYNLTRDETLETVFVMESSDVTEAVASSSPDGGQTGAIILNMNLTSVYSEPYFYMIGQQGNKAPNNADIDVYARLRLLYSNDPLFQFVPVSTYAELRIVNRHLDSKLLDSNSGAIDDTGATIDHALPVMNITAKNGIDYTTDAGGTATLLVSLTEPPVGVVVFTVTVPDKTQAQIKEGKGAVLTFSPTNYQELEVELEGLDDNDNTNGDVPYDVNFNLLSTEDPAYLNRYSTFHFSQTITNLATTSDTRLAISLNTTGCHTTEGGGTCDIFVMVCAHNSMGGEKGDGATSCESPFSSYPIFTSGIKKVAVSLKISDRFEAEITKVASNGRFDASSSQINCNEGVLDDNGDNFCGATVVFEPFASSADGNDAQGPYYAWVTLTGQNDYVLDGPQPVDISIASAKVVHDGDVTSDYVVYTSSISIENYDNDYSSVKLNRNDGEEDVYAGFRYLDVYAGSVTDEAPRCETSESDDVGACPITINFDFEQLNNSVTTRYDEVDCVKVTMEMSYLFSNDTMAGVSVDADLLSVIENMQRTLYEPTLRIYSEYDGANNDAAVITISELWTGVSLSGWSPDDVKDGLSQYSPLFDKNAAVHSVFTATRDHCIPPGNTTVEFVNATLQYKPDNSGPEGGWAASVKVTGTDHYIYYSPDLPTKQYGNMTVHVPNEGVPLFLRGGPTSATVVVNISTGSSALEVTNMVNTSVAVGGIDYSMETRSDITTITATFTSSGSISFYVDSADDDVDDDDEEYQVFATVTEMAYNYIIGDSQYTISPISQAATIPIYHYDDDTAGFRLDALHTESFYAYRTDRQGPSDDVAAGSGHTFSMTHNTTSESYYIDAEGDPARVNSTQFNVTLTSEPRSDVTVTVTAPAIQNKWGWQIEGVPVGGYKVKSYSSPSAWIEGTNDTVINHKSGGLALTFTSSDWNIPQTVTVIGLDDFLYDGDTHYHLKLTSTSNDLYYDSNTNASKNSYSSNSYNTRGYMPSVSVPLVNKDDEKATFVAMQNGTECSEPYYDMDAAVHMYLTSKPSAVVSVWLASSDPNEAGVDRELVAFTPDNWETMQKVKVSSIDDFAADGDVEFDVTIDLFQSADADYDNSELFDMFFNFTSVDDPDDTMGVGAAVQIELVSNTTYTTALGGAVTLEVTLSYKPQAPVYVSVTTSNQNQAVLTTASTLVFTSSNYADVQEVTVQGVDDDERYGDTFYTVILGLESTDDPYYARFAFSPIDDTVSYELINHDYPWARVRLAAETDQVMTSEKDASSGNYTALTIGICEAIYGAVEDGGVAGRQATKLDSTLCGGYSLDADTIFDTDSGIKFVEATIEISESSEAMLECESGAYECSTNYDGQTATLRFDADGYTDLSMFSPQLRVIGKNDYINDGDVAYNVTVTAAHAKYVSERQDILDSYLPPAITLMNKDDDSSDEVRGAWFVVDPAVGCSVFESDMDGTLPDSCSITFTFDDVLRDDIESTSNFANGDVFAFGIDVNISQGGSSVYIGNVMTSDTIYVEGNVSSAGDTSVSMFFYNPAFRWSGNLSASISLDTVNDYYDDGDEDFTVDIFGYVIYNCSDFLVNGIGDGQNCVFLNNLSYTVMGTEFDDDTAGLEVSQNGKSFYSLRTGRNDGVDTDTTSERAISLPSNMTSEDDSTYTMFEVKLSSRPQYDVSVEVTSQMLNDQWGTGRFEGVPSMNKSTDGSDYNVINYVSPASWINSNRTKDSIANPYEAGLTLNFTTSTWNISQMVYVVGLDDLAADGDVSYNLYLTVNGSKNDMYRYSPNDNGFEEPTRLPFKNIDDEESTVGWFTKQHGVKVSEPFYGYSSRIAFYPLTEPADVIMLSFSSTRPDIANTSETLVAISPSDWDQERNIYVNSVDNFLDDGDIDFDVMMLNLGSSDAAYADIIVNETFAFTKIDDPEDSLYHDPDSGVGMEFDTGINLYGVKQAFTTEYGGDGMYLDETAKTGSSTVRVKLSLQPQDTVTYAVAVSDTTEAQILYPSTVAFTSDNWDEYQEVVVIGRADSIADGDVEYDVQFNLVATNDPYYAVLPLNRTSHTLINQDTVTQRVALGISSLSCLNVTEGTETTRGFSVSGRSVCTVQLSLCLSDTDGCTQKLTEAEVYNISEGLGIDSISIEVYMGDKSIARIQDPTSHMDQINVTNNGSFAHIHLGIGEALSTSANLTVYATNDIIHDGKMVTDMLFYGVLQKDSKDVQDFVNYYDDEGDITATTTLHGSSVSTGTINVITRDDEYPDLRFYKTTSCNTGEYGRVETPGQDVSDGTCLVYVRLGAEPASDVSITITSTDASEGLFAMSYDTDGTDSVDFKCSECPSTYTDSQVISFDSTNWDTARKIVLVGQDDTVLDGRQNYNLVAVAASGDTDFDGLNVSLAFANLDDESAFIYVAQDGNKLGARTATNVDEAGYVNSACKPFTVILDSELYGDSSFVSVLTVSSSDATEGLVGTSCDPSSGDYAQNFTVSAHEAPTSISTTGATYYYIAVDDDMDDGDVEFAVTLEVMRPSYTSGAITYPVNTSSFTFYLTNYDDDSLVIVDPDYNQQDENKFTSRSNGHHSLELYEPFNWEPVSADSSTNRTGLLTLSYPNNNTWDSSLTDFVGATVLITFTENVGRYELAFVKSHPTLDTTCTSILMNDPIYSPSCYVVLASANEYLQILVTASPDDVDRNGHKSFANITTTMEYNARDTSGDLISSTTDTKSAWEQSVELVIFEDDLAGIALNQTNLTSTGVPTNYVYQNIAYRDFPRGRAQAKDATVSTMMLPMSTTKESGGNLTFSVALTSEPLVDTYVYVYSEQVTRSDGSETRYEGIPWPSTYDWTKYHPIGDFASQQTEDVVELADPDEANLKLTFTSSNWAEAQDVLIVGMNDLYDDSTVDYNIYIMIESSNSTQDPYYDQIGSITLPFSNEDDDTAGLAAYWTDYSSGPTYGIVSEPYYDYDATLYFYLTSKPTDTVLVTLVSSDPSEAKSTAAVAAIGPSDWDTPQSSLIYGVDDPILDGTQNFTIALAVVYSSDSDYGTTDENEDGVAGRMTVEMKGYALDDPTDSSATACGIGETGMYGNPRSNCTSCPIGTFVDVPGDKTSCRMCPPGTFGAYSGSQGMAISEDYDGTLLAPGCLPCPNGTYNDGYGATSCTPCPDGKFCWPLASTTPKGEKPWEQWASSFDRRWTQIAADPYNAHIEFFGRYVDMNRDQYEAYLIVNSFVVWLIISAILLIIYLFAPHPIRDAMIRFLRKFDLFPRRHQAESKNEEFADRSFAPSALGGVVSVGLFLLGLACTSIMFYMYTEFNTDVTSSLDVFNMTFIDDVSINVGVDVSFIGFTGCSNNTWVLDTTGEGDPEMIVTGASYDTKTTSYECRNGDLDMTVILKKMKVVTNPKFLFRVEPKCQECTDSGETPLYSGNEVLDCLPCSVASAQGFTYSVSSTNTWGESPGVHGSDENFVNGSEVPASATDVFRGDDTTTVQVDFMPAIYDNRQTAKKFETYRLVYAGTDLGSTQSFKGATDFYGTGSVASTPANFFTWVKDDSFVDMDATNVVSFTLDMPLSTSALSVVVENYESFLDVCAQVGGILGLLTAIFLLAMSYVERGDDAQDWIGVFVMSVKSYVQRQRAELHQRWNPEPDTWRMENIDKFQRRTEKKDGGAKKKEEAAVTNFKDLYSRNNLGGQQADEEDEDEDYSNEVDDFHGQL